MITVEISNGQFVNGEYVALLYKLALAVEDYVENSGHNESRYPPATPTYVMVEERLRALARAYPDWKEPTADETIRRLRDYATMASTLTATQKRGDELLERARTAELRVDVAIKKIELLAVRTKANILGRSEIERETARILGVLKDPLTTEQLHELYPPHEPEGTR